jgi:outer membrane protein assembly factor BamA
VSPLEVGDSERAMVKVVIEEGPQFRIAKIAITGGGFAPAELAALEKLFVFKSGDVFNRSTIAAARERMVAKIVEGGRANPAVSVLTKIDKAKRTIDLTFEVEAAPRSR